MSQKIKCNYFSTIDIGELADCFKPKITYEEIKISAKSFFCNAEANDPVQPSPLYV
jgi:hypothetical protein